MILVILLIVIVLCIAIYKGRHPNDLDYQNNSTTLITKPKALNYINKNTGTTTNNLLKICPDERIENHMPTIGISNQPANSYYIINGMRREITEFDTNWVQNNCTIPTQVVN